jgi:hypothetical protein
MNSVNNLLILKELRYFYVTSDVGMPSLGPPVRPFFSPRALACTVTESWAT